MPTNEVPELAEGTTKVPLRLPRDRRGPFIWMIVLSIVLTLGLIAVGWLLVNWQLDAIVMAIPALIPLTLVLLAVHFLDRWEPEPTILLVLCFVYGAGASILGTLTVGNFLLEVTNTYARDSVGLAAWSILLQGPFVEELVKGVGVAVLLIIAWREVNGPLDGFVYAAVIGAGFAFTENIVYFASSGSTGLEFVWLLVVRGILSPFAHVMFTGVIGLALGWAAQQRKPLQFGIAGVLGLVMAVGLHAFWNGASIYLLPLIGVDAQNPFAWIISYGLFQLPLFLAFGWLLMQLQHRDRQIIRNRLDEYRRAGWFTTAEVEMITNWQLRRKAIHWAREQSPEQGRAMKNFVEDATRLAFAREHASIDKRDPHRRAIEKSLLAVTRRDRKDLQDMVRSKA
ncbi:PrsW family intramembrane metalloprotease [Gulosibacter sp. ACHW.36C]|uniref:PrsW family intramembrane metalloprotease n=1 Tax=Gulosibacter sediminis TaxID=1729695 RepID=A0ABY4MZS1_9MICO|nr:PrsW family intramembrane metalloprotease [Gulosibacter sediminis]UQN15950.1 PrsW family intramembrane metalloprotease [Gulosibacter sediminis]